MAERIQILVYPAPDVDAAKTFFNKYLGVEPYVDGEYYVGYKTGGLEVGLDPNGEAVIAYIDVDDIKASLKELTDAGSTIAKDVRDVGGGLLIATVQDQNGNVLGLRQETK